MTSAADLARYRQLEETVSVLEARIFNLQRNPTQYDDVFPEAARALYYHLLGQAYLGQFHLANATAYATFTNKCLRLIHDGVKMAIVRLEPGDYMRLLCIHTYCRILLEIGNSPFKAKFVAERCFSEASSCDNVLDEKALSILQKLRDDFMSFDPEQQSPDTSDPRYSPSEGCQDGIEEVQELFATKTTAASQKDKSSAEILAEQARANNPALSAKITTVRRLRRGINVLRPVVVETLPSSAAIIRGMDQIFRAYIRGNALPAHLAGMNTVDFAGQTITFRAFVLDGPYLSWKGFLGFLLDFQIAKAPSKSTKSGKFFLQSLSPSMKEGFLAAAANTQEPLLKMAEAATLFLEASSSMAPALALGKSVRVYADLAREQGAQQDVWAPILAWAEDLSEREWDISCGLNFMQFVDCLGKMGIIGYSSPYFQEMLPTVPAKVEHFLSAYLGLADKRRWQQKVDNKLQAVKAAITQLANATETNKAQRPNSRAATTKPPGL